MSKSAWPRAPGMKHIVLLGTGCPAEADASKEKLARNLAIQAPAQVLGADADVNILPNGLENYHDVVKVCGSTKFFNASVSC